MALTAEQLRRAGRSIALWRADPQTPVACPACGQAGLKVIDRSARPHAEWYVLDCTACGLCDMLHVPLGAPMAGLD